MSSCPMKKNYDVEITTIKSYELPLSTKIINQMVYHITRKMTEMSTTTET